MAMHARGPSATPLRHAVLGLLEPLLARLVGAVGTRDGAMWAAHRAWGSVAAGQCRKVQFYARMAIAHDRTWADGHRMLGLSYRRQGDLQRERGAYERGLAAAPRDTLLMAALADAHYDLADYAMAERLYRRALQEAGDPDEGGAPYLGLGLSVYKQGRAGEAAELLEQGRRHAPRDTKLALALGEVLMRQNEYPDAIRLFEEVIGAEPANGRADYDLAWGLMALGRWQRAADHAWRARELLPADEGIRRLLAALDWTSATETGGRSPAIAGAAVDDGTLAIGDVEIGVDVAGPPTGDQQRAIEAAVQGWYREGAERAFGGAGFRDLAGPWLDGAHLRWRAHLGSADGVRAMAPLAARLKALGGVPVVRLTTEQERTSSLWS